MRLIFPSTSTDFVLEIEGMPLQFILTFLSPKCAISICSHIILWYNLLIHSLLFGLQNVPPAILLRFLREHRSEWADNNVDAYSATAVKVGPCTFLGSQIGSFGGQVILPLAQTIEHGEASNLNFFSS